VSERYDVAVVGAGIIGLASARELLIRRPNLRLLVLDKESEPAVHQSGHNSGVLHSGIYYRPGTLKARLCREGKRLLEEYAARKGIPVVQRGKLVVALTESELPRLEELKRRGKANGVPGLRELGREEIRELEPHSAGIRALYSPETAVVDFRKVAAGFADDVRAAGGTVQLGAEVRDIVERTGRRVLDTAAGTFEAGAVVSCAGLQGDRVTAITGLRSETRLVPFRGDYYTLAPGARGLVNGLIYPVPDLTFPFLGVHFTKTVDGEVLAGPNAVLALAREGYRRRDVVLRDTLDTIRYPGFWRLARRHYRTGLGELWRDFVKGAFVREMRRYLPNLGEGDVRFGPSGVRAQFLTRDGMLIDDFLVVEGSGVLHVLNAPSPGATSSLAIGRLVADRAERLIPA
jgi:(S)-2-hydroxyglutarate dehydrogenase